MGKYGVKVCIRTRPTASFAQDQIIIDADKSVSCFSKRFYQYSLSVALLLYIYTNSTID